MSVTYFEYGRVADLCICLNYNPIRGGTARPYSDLTNKTVKHRKNFVKHVLNKRVPPIDFPLTYNDPDAQLCALNFLEQNATSFKGDSSVIKGRLAYPADRDEIVNVLTKVICTQASMYLHNKGHVEVKDEQFNKEDTIVVAAPSIEQEPVTATSMSSPLTTTQNREEQILELDKTVLANNIQINLDTAYPLEPEPSFTENQWVFDNDGHWPDALQPFTFRWLHEHKAYRIHHASGHVQHFVTALKKHLGLPHMLTPNQDNKIHHKCYEYLRHWLTIWSCYGLLVRTGDAIFPHRDLERSLTIRRAQYIALVRNSKSEGPSLATPPNSRSQASLKRSIVSMDDTSLEISEAKRPKPASKSQSELRGCDSYTEPWQSVVPGHMNHHCGQPDEDNTGHPAGKILSSIRFLEPHNSHFEAVRTENNHQLPHKTQTSVVSSGTTTPAPQPLLSQNTIAQELLQVQDSSDMMRHVSTPFTSPGAEHPIEHLLQSTPPPQLQSPATLDVKPEKVKPNLLLIVEKAEGALNTENPLHESDLRNSTLSEFLEKVRSRRQNPEQFLVPLRLVQRWGAKTSFFVDQDTTDEKWKQIRSNIRKNFVLQGEKKPRKTRFEVYVICEIDTETSEDDEE